MNKMNRRRFLINSSLTACWASAGALAADSHLPIQDVNAAIAGRLPNTTFSLEQGLQFGARHLERLVDAEGRTYFDVFLGRPSEAVTDWPDFVDLPSRYWEATVLVGAALGTRIGSQERLAGWLFPKIEADGLAYRPDGPISNHVAELFDQSRLFYALNSAVMQNPEDALARKRLAALADGLKLKSTRAGNYAFIEKIGLYFGGTLIRPMLQAGIVLNRPDLIELTSDFARGVVDHSDLIGENGSFTGHVHAALCCTAGIIATGVKTGNPHLVARGRAAFDFARSISTEFGWVPELSKREDDVIACETCAIMDYLDAALLLARHVDPAYYDVVEKAVRNHLWESQLRDAHWLGSVGTTDEDGIIRTDLLDRVHGSFCGWSAPHCSLAYYEELPDGWVKTSQMRSRYLRKVRAQQNCCAAAGIRAMYQVWSAIVTEDAACSTVNLSLDRATPQLQVTSFLPFEGKVRITARQDGGIRWRRPSHCAPGDLHAIVAGKRTEVRHEGGFVNLGTLRAGTVIDLSFPLPERKQSITIGNHGYQQYRFDLDWRGDTVMSIRPDSGNPADALTKLMGKRVTSFYNRQGPGPLYERSGWSAGLSVRQAQIVSRSSQVDWYKL